MPKLIGAEQHGRQEDHRNVGQAAASRWQSCRARQPPRPRPARRSAPRRRSTGAASATSAVARSSSGVTTWMAIPARCRVISSESERPQKPSQPARARAAEDDLRDVLAPRIAQHFGGQIAGGEPRRLGAEPRGERQRLVDPLQRRGIARSRGRSVRDGRRPSRH